MSKEFSDLNEDQEFAFSKYSSSTVGSQAVSNTKSQNLDMATPQNVWPQYSHSTSPQEFLSSAKPLTTTAQTDLSDLNSMRQYLLKSIPKSQVPSMAIETPHLFAKQQDVFARHNPQEYPAYAYSTWGTSPVLQNLGAPHSHVQANYSVINPQRTSDYSKANIDQSVDMLWNTSDAELLTRFYEQIEVPSQFAPQSQQLPMYYASGYKTQLHDTTSNSFYPHSAGQSEVIADQNWVEYSQLGISSPPSFQSQNSLDDVHAVLKEGTFRDCLEFLWQRINEVLDTAVRQIVSHNANLIGSNRQETHNYHEHIEKQILFLADLMRKIEGSLEKIKNPGGTQMGVSREQQDIKSVLFSIDQDISRTFGKLVEVSPEKRHAIGISKKYESETIVRPSSNSDQVMALVDNVQKTILRLQDRMMALESANTGLKSSFPSYSRHEKQGGHEQAHATASKLKFFQAEAFQKQRTKNFLSLLLQSVFSRTKGKVNSQDFGLIRNRQLTVFALGLVIVFSSASLVFSSLRPSLSTYPLSTKKNFVTGLTNQNSDPVVIQEPISPRVSENTLFFKPLPQRSDNPPNVTEEFFKFSQYSIGSF